MLNSAFVSAIQCAMSEPGDLPEDEHPPEKPALILNVNLTLTQVSELK